MAVAANPPLRIVRDDGEAWSLDGVVRIARERRITITDHPVETGSPVSDHAQRDPFRETVAGTVTATPLEGRTWDQPTGQARLDAALDFFASCVGLSVSLEFSDVVLDGYLLASWTHERTAHRAIKFALEFKEVVMATAAVVEIPVTQPVAAAAAALPDEVDIGEQAAKDIERSRALAAAATAQKRESWAHAWLYGSSLEEA